MWLGLGLAPQELGLEALQLLKYASPAGKGRSQMRQRSHRVVPSLQNLHFIYALTQTKVKQIPVTMCDITFKHVARPFM